MSEAFPGDDDKTAAQRIVERLDAMTQAEHEGRIEAARARARARESSRHARAVMAARRLRGDQ